MEIEGMRQQCMAAETFALNHEVRCTVCVLTFQFVNVFVSGS